MSQKHPQTSFLLMTSGVQLTPEVSSRDKTPHCLKIQGKLITPLEPPHRLYCVSLRLKYVLQSDQYPVSRLSYNSACIECSHRRQARKVTGAREGAGLPSGSSGCGKDHSSPDKQLARAVPNLAPVREKKTPRGCVCVCVCVCVFVCVCVCARVFMCV